MKAKDVTKRQLLYFLVFSLLGIGLGFYYGADELPLLYDNQHYFYMSERVASGFSPYKSHFDPKHACSMLITGAAISIGRVVGVDDVYSARILSLIILGASIGLIWVLAYQLTKSTRASTYAALCMLSFSYYMLMGAIGSRPKMFLVFFMLLTMLFFSRENPFWAGLFASLCFLCWQPALLMLGALFLVLTLYNNRFKNIGFAILGAILPILMYEAYFILTDSLWAQLEQTYYFPSKFMLYNFHGFAESFIELAIIWAWGFGKLNVLPYIFVYGLIRYWIQFFRDRESLSSFISKEPKWVYFHLCMYGTLLFTFYDHQGPPDLFFVLPFVAIMSGWVLDRSVNDIRSFLQRSFGHIAHPLCLFFLLALIVWSASFAFDTPYLNPPYTLSDQYKLSEKVKEFLAESQKVYAVGCTHLLGFSHSENWMIYGYFFRGVCDFISHKTGADVFEPVKNNEWPSVILVSDTPPCDSQKWLDTLYTEITTTEFKRQRIKVFRLKKQIDKG